MIIILKYIYIYVYTYIHILLIAVIIRTFYQVLIFIIILIILTSWFPAPKAPKSSATTLLFPGSPKPEAGHN